MRWLLLFIILFSVILPVVDAAECSADVDMSPSSLQFGDEFVLEGSNVDFGNGSYTGNVIVEFYSGEYTHQIYGSVYKGNFEIPGFFSTDLDLNGVGDFDAKLKFVRNGDVACELDSIANFYVTNELIAVSKLDKSQIDPGDVLRLTGDVTYKNGVALGNGEVVITLDNKEYTSAVSNGKYDFTLSTSNTITSNLHEFQVSVKDEYGNIAVDSFKFYINPIVSRITIDLEANQLTPGDELIVSPRIFDQAGEEMFDDVEVRIYDSKEDRVFDETRVSGQKINYAIDSTYDPGVWVAKARYGEMITDIEFTVVELKSISVELDDQNLVVKNIGNIKYDEDFIMVVSNSEEQEEISKRTKLKPGDELIIELFKEINPGIYTITVQNTGQSFENIEIVDERNLFQKGGDVLAGFTGNAIRKSGSSTSNLSTYVLISLLVLVVFLVLFFRYKPSGGIHINKLIQNHGTSKQKTSKKVEPTKPKSKISKLNLKSTKSEIDDFKSRILKDIKETEKRKVEVEKERAEKPWRHSAPQKQEKGKFEFRPKSVGVKTEEKVNKVDFDMPMEKEEKKEEPTNLFKMFD